MINIIPIFVLRFVTHFLGDFTHLSTDTMLKAKRFGEPLAPIFAHACVHGILAFITYLFFFDFFITLILSIIQIIFHYFIDMCKGWASKSFPILQDNTKNPFWYLFGVDQLAHYLVIAFEIYIGISTLMMTNA